MKIDATNKYFKELNEEISEAIEKDDTIILSGICGQRYIGAGLPKGKKIEIYGISGNDLGCYMDGTDIEVFASGQDAVGNTMNDGSIVIHGSAGDALGYAMRGGKIFIEKNVGYRCGIHMKEFKEAKPVIVIGGYAGAFLGEYMAGGIVVLLGRNLPEDKFAAAGYCATGMHGGVMYLPKSIPLTHYSKEVKVEETTDDDKAVIEKYIDVYCGYFGADKSEFDVANFVKVRPASSRPYGNIYVRN
jgi:glutamate synthase domain-containing protein 3